jgi:hypothetical protein
MAEILLIQDDDAEVLMTVEALSDNKLLNRLVVINDSEHALRYLRRRAPTQPPKPDLLLDLRLPRLDGYGGAQIDPTRSGARGTAGRRAGPPGPRRTTATAARPHGRGVPGPTREVRAHRATGPHVRVL